MGYGEIAVLIKVEGDIVLTLLPRTGKDAIQIYDITGVPVEASPELAVWATVGKPPLKVSHEHPLRLTLRGVQKGVTVVFFYIDRIGDLP